MQFNISKLKTSCLNQGPPALQSAMIPLLATFLQLCKTGERVTAPSPLHHGTMVPTVCGQKPLSGWAEEHSSSPMDTLGWMQAFYFSS